MSLMRGSNVPYVIALTKTDKLSGNERSKSLRELKDVLKGFAMEVPIIQTSSKTRRGREELLGWVDAVVAI